ncbi:MAG: ABC transporter ATP-binding protein [Firmicutes bacterium]|nr:ABC transporter ATP-binding protein [Bacillota bacterium]
MIKKLSAYIGEYMAATILTPLMVTLEAVMEILIPLIMADLIDKGIDTGNMSAITRYGLLLLGAALLALAFGVLSGRFAAVSSSGFAKNLRQAMFYKVQTYSFSNIDHFSTASIVTRLTTDVTNIQNAFHMMTRIAFRAPAMLIFALIASFRIDAEMSMIFVAVLPVLGIGMFLIIRKVYPIFNTVFRSYDKLNNVVQENLYAMRVVKSYNRQEHETEKFRKMSGAICKDFVTAEKNMMLAMPLMQFCMYTCILLISWLGARAILASGNDAALGLSTGELLSLITYVMQILMSLMMISMIIVQLTMAKASADRIVEILEEESDIHNPEHPVYEVKDGSVAFDHVSFAYGKCDGHRGQNALSDICLEIRSGETVGILGGTGSSKSTLVQMIPRLYDVTGGRVLVGGVDVREYDMETLRKQVAMVLQKNVLFSGTIKENLRWGNENASDEELQRVCRLACADEFIQDMEQGYDTMIEQGGTNVSGGQRQRLCIARALLAHPKILILDDSTSAVDMKTDALIRRAFAEEIPDTTKIIIAQRVASVQDADKIVVLDDGKIAAVGTHEELLATNAIYQEVYQSQNRTGLEEGGVA